MKKVTTILFTMLTASVFGQNYDNLFNANWKPGTAKIIYDNSILRLEGTNDTRGMLNVAYQSLEQLKAEVEKEADEEMWTPEKKNDLINTYETYAQGGKVMLYLERLTIHSANTDMFTVIIRDSTDSKEILRKELKSDVPNVPSRGSSYWWNYTSVWIPKQVEGKIYVYVIDKLGHDDNKKFKFEVTIP